MSRSASWASTAGMVSMNAMSCLLLVSASRALSRMHPLREELMWIQIRAARVRNAGVGELLEDASAGGRLEQIHAAAHVFPSNVDLRDRWRPAVLLQGRSDPGPQFPILKRHAVDIH